MEGLDPKRWAELVDEYFPTWGRLLNRTALLFLILLVIGLGGVAFFQTFIGNVVWPFLTNLFGAPDTGVTLDNIEAIIVVLVATIVFFVVIFALFVLFAYRTFKRRVIPQDVIDQLAEHRKAGVTIYAKRLKLDDEQDFETMTDKEKQAVIDPFVEEWAAEWKAWSSEVGDFMDANFSKAEALSFKTLGVVLNLPFRQAVNDEHMRHLGIIAKQITTLEDLIQRHQERR